MLCTEEYNGSSWTAGGALSTARYDLAGAGTQNAALAIGGVLPPSVVSCTEEYVYVVEGPIDSMFLENAIATADSNLTSAAKHIDKSKVVLVYDNEPRNKELHKQMDKAIEEHYNVVIWPEMIEEKDVNDMILAGFSPEEIQDIISKNTFVNLRAKMEFVNWKKT